MRVELKSALFEPNTPDVRRKLRQAFYCIGWSDWRRGLRIVSQPACWADAGGFPIESFHFALAGLFEYNSCWVLETS